MSTPTAMTAIPGVTVQQATDLATGPDALEYDNLVATIVELMTMAGRGSRPEDPDAHERIQVISIVVARAKVVSALARHVSRTLLEMSDAEKALVAADAMGQMAELACGYRAKLETGGFSTPVAEHMAAQFHTVLLTRASGE